MKNRVLMAIRMEGNPVLKYSEFSTQHFGEANVALRVGPNRREECPTVPPDGAPHCTIPLFT